MKTMSSHALSDAVWKGIAAGLLAALIGVLLKVDPTPLFWTGACIVGAGVAAGVLIMGWARKYAD